MAQLDADDELRVAILTGVGTTFCAGMDLVEIGLLRQPEPANEWIARTREDPTLIPRGWLKTEVPTKPIILAAEGFARAGGTEILQGTTLRVAGESAVFGVTEVQRGLFPMMGSAVRLRRQIPYAVAAEMLLTGDDITAQRAYEVGLINYVVPDGQAVTKAKEIADRHREQRTRRRQGDRGDPARHRVLPDAEAFPIEQKYGRRSCVRRRAGRTAAFLEKRPRSSRAADVCEFAALASPCSTAGHGSMSEATVERRPDAEGSCDVGPPPGDQGHPGPSRSGTGRRRRRGPGRVWTDWTVHVPHRCSSPLPCAWICRPSRVGGRAITSTRREAVPDVGGQAFVRQTDFRSVVTSH